MERDDGANEGGRLAGLPAGFHDPQWEDVGAIGFRRWFGCDPPTRELYEVAQAERRAAVARLARRGPA